MKKFAIVSVVAGLFAVIFVGCGEDTKSTLAASTVDPKYASITIQPQIIHMKVGDTKRFIAQGGDGTYKFRLPSWAECNFNLSASGNEATLTLVTTSCGGWSTLTSVTLYVDSPTVVVFSSPANIYIDK